MRRVILLSFSMILAALLGCAASTEPQGGAQALPTGDDSRTSLD